MKGGEIMLFFRKDKKDKVDLPDIDYDNIIKILKCWSKMEKFVPTEFPEVSTNMAKIYRNFSRTKRKHCFQYEYNQFKNIIQYYITKNPDMKQESLYNVVSVMIKDLYGFDDYILSNLDICAGSISKRVVLKILSQIYHNPRIYQQYLQKEEALGDVEYCAYGFEIGDDSLPNEWSFNLSPLIWELACYRQSGQAEETESLNLYNQRINIEIKSERKKQETFDFAKIEKLYERVAGEMSGLLGDRMNGYVYFEMVKKNKNKKEEPLKPLSYHKMNQSFIANDLKMILEYYQENKGALSDKYFDIRNFETYNPEPKKTAINQDIKALKNLLTIDKYPVAKWPSIYPPALMQQAAINQTVSQDSVPVFSVNGPPGTGKTTLLKEIIADYVVKRAVELSKLQNPEDAFECFVEFEESKLKNGNEHIGYYKLKEKFMEYGIIVASCNNTAVENITKELPRGESLKSVYDESEKELKKKTLTSEFDFTSNQEIYFSELASRLLNPKKKTLSAWGLVSAALGKSSNRKIFCDQILSPVIEGKYGDNQEAFADRDDFKESQKKFAMQYSKVTGMRTKLKQKNQFWKNMDLEDCDFQSKNPVENTEYDRERERLFYYALQLHKAFVMAENKPFRRNLEILWSKLKDNSGKIYKMEIGTDYYTHVFNTLFFLVPVVSTTFASVERMFEHIVKPHSFGLLIVDEAGQASPPMAAGTSFRSKRALIVGDPKQVEPVVTTDDDFQEYILGNIDEIYKRKEESVQSYADRLNPIGAYARGMEKVWTGCPLNIHRRCNDPMFSISNGISYENTMYDFSVYLDWNKVEDKKIMDTFIADKSYWIEESGAVTRNKHYVENQGKLVRKIVEMSYLKNGGNLKLFIISPFKDVGMNIRDEIRMSTILPDSEEIDIWCNNNIGTVHKFQGKEAEEVIFVLGCSSDGSNIGAIRWVNSNIINVAVTRAKQRLYIIGDRNCWADVNVLFDNFHLWRYAANARKGYDLNYISSTDFAKSYLSSKETNEKETLISDEAAVTLESVDGKEVEKCNESIKELEKEVVEESENEAVKEEKNEAAKEAESTDKEKETDINIKMKVLYQDYINIKKEMAHQADLFFKKEMGYRGLIKMLCDKIVWGGINVYDRVSDEQRKFLEQILPPMPEGQEIPMGRCPFCGYAVYQGVSKEKINYKCLGVSKNQCTFSVYADDSFFVYGFRTFVTTGMIMELLRKGYISVIGNEGHCAVKVGIRKKAHKEAGKWKDWEWYKIE